MAEYNKNITEQFLGPEKLAVGWPVRLFLFSIILFGLVLFIYFGLIWGYQPFLQSEKQTLDTKLSEIGGSISEADRQNFINFYSQLINLQSLLSAHVKSSVVFDLLEKNTNQGVYFEDSDFSVSDGFLRLSGVARTYENLVQQLLAFEEIPEVEKAILQDSQAAEKGIRFSIQVNFKPELLRLSQPQ